MKSNAQPVGNSSSGLTEARLTQLTFGETTTIQQSMNAVFEYGEMVTIRGVLLRVLCVTHAGSPFVKQVFNFKLKFIEQKKDM